MKQFVTISISEIKDKWLLKFKKDTRGFLPIGTELESTKEKFDGRVNKKDAHNMIYVCPFCATYFILPEQAFLHLRPGVW